MSKNNVITISIFAVVAWAACVTTFIAPPVVAYVEHRHHPKDEESLDREQTTKMKKILERANERSEE